jgi:FkbM family methyltransferase
MADDIKTITLGGIKTRFVGDTDDAYFQGLQRHAADLDVLAGTVRRWAPSDSTALDVGANIGLSAILMARLVGKVIAYEPSPPNLAFLRRNLVMNNISNVEVVAAAASDRPGSMQFHVSQFGAGSHVVATGHVAGSVIQTTEVAALPLDSQNLPKISFIKLDAEGHEPNVLAGAKSLLERDRPLIFTEVNVWCLCAFAGHSPGALVRTLWQSFDVAQAEPDGSLTPLPDGYGFLYQTIVHNSGVADIVLRPRPGMSMPTLAELSWPLPAVLAFRAASASSG